MPQKDDFLTRLMEQLTQVLRRVLLLKEAGRYDEALSLIGEAYRAHTGSGSEMVHRLPSRDLLALLSSGGSLDVEKCLLIAELLDAEREVREADGEVVPATHPLKALELYLAALLAEPELTPDYQEKVARLQDALARHTLPLETQRRLFEYHALGGRYAEAENWLYRLLEVQPDDETVARGRDFYSSLLGLPDEVLERGGLPREEVQEGLRGLEQAPSRPTT